MSLRPDLTQHRSDPQLDRYRDRVGRLLRGETEVGLVLVRVQVQVEQAGGHLWWRRWGPPQDALLLWTIVDGQFADHWLADSLDEELAAYDAGRFDYYGEELGVRWVDAEESAQLIKSAFEQ